MRILQIEHTCMELLQVLSMCLPLSCWVPKTLLVHAKMLAANTDQLGLYKHMLLKNEREMHYLHMIVPLIS